MAVRMQTWKKLKKRLSIMCLTILLTDVLWISGPLSSDEDITVVSAADFSDREVLQTAKLLFNETNTVTQSTKGVVVEMYTATWCPPCVYSDDALDRLAEEYHDSVSVVMYHPTPDQEDPFGFSEGSDRMSLYYGATSFPTVKIDGIVDKSGGYPGVYDDIKAGVSARLGTPSYFGMELSGGIGPTAGNFKLKITKNSNAGDVSAYNLRARAVLFEDHRYFQGSNGVTDHRFVARSVVEDTTLDFSSDTVYINRSFEVSAAWDTDNMAIVAFIQSDGKNPQPPDDTSTEDDTGSDQDTQDTQDESTSDTTNAADSTATGASGSDKKSDGYILGIFTPVQAFAIAVSAAFGILVSYAIIKGGSGEKKGKKKKKRKKDKKRKEKETKKKGKKGKGRKKK